MEESCRRCYFVLKDSVSITVKIVSSFSTLQYRKCSLSHCFNLFFRNINSTKRRSIFLRLIVICQPLNRNRFAKFLLTGVFVVAKNYVRQEKQFAVFNPNLLNNGCDVPSCTWRGCLSLTMQVDLVVLRNKRYSNYTN